MATDNIFRLNILLKGESANRFTQIMRFLGLENDTEAIRTIINWYYRQYENELCAPPKSMWHLNLESNGVLIWDPDVRKAVQVSFGQHGIFCQYDNSDYCRHIKFAISKPDIQDVIRKHRKEGWKLPDV
jgi:hypothetical protein